MLDTSAREEFFEQTLPAMVTLALRLPILCTQVSGLITVLLRLTISLPDIYLKQQEVAVAACMYWLTVFLCILLILMIFSIKCN